MRTITVTGTGKVFVTPDKATVDLAVITRNLDIKAAQEENATNMARVIEAISKMGIPTSDIQTYDYGISQETHWKDDERVYGKYNVTNKIKVNVSDIEKASGVIDIAVQNGATGIDSLSFSYKDDVKAVKRARELAIENAKTIAQESVNTAGVRLGKILVLEERSATRPSYMSRLTSNSLTQSWDDAALYAVGPEGSTPLSTGQKEISVIIDMICEIK